MSRTPEDDGDTWVETSFVLQTEPAVPVTAPALLDPRVTDEAPDRYQEGVELGKGGMGRVTLVDDLHLHRQIARKELRVTSPALRTRFLREARITAQLQHPGIVAIHEVGRRPDGTLYYTMSQVRGRTLSQALIGARTAPERLALLGSFVEVCQAVAYAHSMGVLHRDLKPENVMIGPFGETVLLDWGLARVIDDDEDAAGAVLGTPRYMSPEQARGEPVDTRSDIWSLGAILYELLSGSTPFEGPTRLVLEHAADATVEPPAMLPDGTPPELVAIAMKALSRFPEDRYPTAAALAADVEAFRTGSVVSAHDYSALDQMKRVASRGRIGLAIAGTALVVAAGSWTVLGNQIAAQRVLADVEYSRAQTAEAVIDALELERVGEREAALARALPLPDRGLRERLVAAGADARVLSEAPAALPRFSHSGAQLAWAEGPVVRIGDPASGTELGQVRATDTVTALAFTDADDGVLIEARDGTVSRLAFLDGKHEKVVQAVPAPPTTPLPEGRQTFDAEGEAAVRSDGGEVAIAGPGGVRVWRVLAPDQAVPAPQTNLRVCPDGRVVPVLPFPPVDLLVAPREACQD